MTNQDLYLVIGIIVTGLSLPSLLGAMSDRRPPRVAAIALVIGGGLIMMALSQAPGGYTWADVPEAFIRVIAHYFR